MQELTMTPATVVLLLFILAWAVWAVRRLFFRGLCDCHGSEGRKKGAPGSRLQQLQRLSWLLGMLHSHP